MSRRLIVLGLLAVISQSGVGCYHVRQCIANRWHHFHGNGGASCAPACCTPSFRIPPPVPILFPRAAYAHATAGAPVSAGAPAPGCATCNSGAVPPVTYLGPTGPIGPTVPVGVVGPAGGGPVFTTPMPILPGPTVEPVPTPLPAPRPTGN